MRSVSCLPSYRLFTNNLMYSIASSLNPVTRCKSVIFTVTDTFQFNGCSCFSPGSSTNSLVHVNTASGSPSSARSLGIKSPYFSIK